MIGDPLLEAADAGLARRHQLHLPALRLGEAGVHAEQLGREQRRLLAAGPGPDLEQHVLLVVGVLGQQQDFDLLDQLVAPRRQPAQLLLGELPEIGVAGLREALGLRDLLHDDLVVPEPLDERFDLRQRLRVRAVLRLVGLHGRVGHLPQQFLVVALDGIQLVNHRTITLAAPRPLTVTRRRPAAETPLRRHRRAPRSAARTPR